MSLAANAQRILFDIIKFFQPSAAIEENPKLELTKKVSEKCTSTYPKYQDHQNKSHG